MSEDGAPYSTTSAGNLEEIRDTSNSSEEENGWPGYDRDETIRAISGLFETLQRMYLPIDSLQYLPAEGWTWPASITFSPLKTDVVLDLMRHMPKLIRPRE